MKNKAKQPLGPWRTTDVIIYDEEGNEVAEAGAADFDYSQAEEHARLIAAAPEMLDALEHAASALANECSGIGFDWEDPEGWPGDGLAFRVFSRIRAVIAKAR